MTEHSNIMQACAGAGYLQDAGIQLYINTAKQVPKRQ